MALTEEQKAAAKAERARRQREWWAKMTPEQRKEKREMYLYNLAQKRRGGAAE